MAIRSKNIDENNSYNEFAQQVLACDVSLDDTTASRASSSSVCRVRMPWAGKILSAYQAFGVTSGSVDLAVHKNGTAISDVVTASTTASAFTLTATTFAAGDYLGVIATTADTEHAFGSVTIVVRPYLGVQERVTASLGDA
jgi:hypothetical protein